MTNKQMERIADNALSAMAKRKVKEFENKTIPHPANKNAIVTFKKQWRKKLEDKLNLIERRKANDFYGTNPDAFQKDWEDAYYARFIIGVTDDDWVKFLEG